jgi:mono/diheme cytochrome c family protein
MTPGASRRLACVVAIAVAALGAGARAQQPAGPSTADSGAGKKLFVQRCSVCHLPALGPGQPRPVARALNGLVKSPETEAAARVIIQRGIPQRMPGFQYGLDAAEIDRLVAYLRTLK